jgi:hypothetical protein
VLPEHASAYFSPRQPPTSTSHQTLETEAVRLDPAIDPDNAVTQPLNVDGLQPPPWLGERLRSDAPTVLVPLVRARRQRRRLIAAIIAAGVGVLGGVVYGVTRPLPPRQTASFAPPASAASLAVASTTKASSEPKTTAPALPAPTPEATEPVPAAEPSGENTTQPEVTSAPKRRAQAAARRVPAAGSSPSAWLKSEPPKAWFK